LILKEDGNEALLFFFIFHKIIKAGSVKMNVKYFTGALIAIPEAKIDRDPDPFMTHVSLRSLLMRKKIEFLRKRGLLNG